MSFVFFLFDFFVIIFIYFYFILFHFIIHHTFIFFNSQDFTALVGLQAYTRMPGLGFIYIYILKGWMAKYTSNVANDVSSIRPDHSGHPMVAKKSGQCPFYSKTRLNFKSF
jgi:hypothetical protein